MQPTIKQHHCFLRKLHIGKFLYYLRYFAEMECGLLNFMNILDNDSIEWEAFYYIKTLVNYNLQKQKLLW